MFLKNDYKQGVGRFEMRGRKLTLFGREDSFTLWYRRDGETSLLRTSLSSFEQDLKDGYGKAIDQENELRTDPVRRAKVLSDLLARRDGLADERRRLDDDVAFLLGMEAEAKAASETTVATAATASTATDGAEWSWREALADDQRRLDDNIAFLLGTRAEAASETTAATATATTSADDEVGDLNVKRWRTVLGRGRCEGCGNPDAALYQRDGTNVTARRCRFCVFRLEDLELFGPK